MRRPVYRGRPIAEITSLARALSRSPGELEQLCVDTDGYYFPAKPQQKPDGTLRHPYGVNNKLKSVQDAVRRTILDRVKYPPYLQGCIRDKESPRSYIVDAALHANSGIVIGMDISRFYPSTKAETVFDIWKYFFDFSAGVAHLLTRLTIFRGSLPEGASTSPGLANLVFFDKEPALEEDLQQRGLLYGRYVDDVTVSADRYLTLNELRYVFTQVFGMFRSKDLSPNRTKTKIATKRKPLQVHKLNVNSGRPTLPKRERARIRAAVKECELHAERDLYCSAYAQLWRRTEGRVRMMQIMHPKEANAYIRRLAAIRPPHA